MEKVLIFATNTKSVIDFRKELIDSFLSQKVKVVLCVPKDSNYDLLYSVFKNIEIVPINIKNTSKNVFNDLATIFRLFCLFRRYRPDTILSYHIKPIIYGSIVAYLSRVKNIYSVVTGLGYAFTANNSYLTKFFIRPLLFFALSVNKKIFFQNPNDVQFICNTEKLKAKSVLVNGSGVNIDYFKFYKSPDKLSFVFIGRLLAHKGIYEYVEAARRLKKKYPDVPFKIAGGFHSNPTSITSEELKGWCKENIIQYLGEVSDIRPVLKDSSVCVLPSYREGCPRAVLEALAVGRPIITTDAPGCRETVVNNKNGFLIPVKNVDQLVRSMEAFIKDPTLVKKMGRNSRAYAEQKFDVVKVNAVILDNMELPC